MARTQSLYDKISNNERRITKWLPKAPPRVEVGQSFNEWLKEIQPRWTWDWAYLLYIQSRLEAVERGELKRLMIFVPPRHGKSEMSTIRFPVYLLEKDPERRIIIAAYNTDLAAKFSRKAKNLASTRLSMSADKTSAADWETAAGGGCMAAGVGSGVTGKGADFIFIDDPVKSREEAESASYRERCWDWYTDDLSTRLEPGGAIVLIMTRWHEDDLAGRILKSKDAKNWEVIRFPAIAEDPDEIGRLVADGEIEASASGDDRDVLGRKPGQALCPERYDVARLKELKLVLTDYSFQALFQQRPGAKAGVTFKKGWFRYFKDAGEFYRLYKDGEEKVFRKSDCYYAQFIDVAGTIKQSADDTVITTIAVTPDRDMLVVDILAEKMETTKHESMVMNTYRRWHPHYVGVESKTYGLNLFQRLVVLGLPVIELVADSDKVSRSIPIQTRYMAGTVYHLLDADWLDDFEQQMLSFPMGAHDDKVDTISYAGIYLARYAPLPETAIADDEIPPDDRKKGSVAKRLGFGQIDESEDEYQIA